MSFSPGLFFISVIAIIDVVLLVNSTTISFEYKREFSNESTVASR